mmetsp:Transcript_56737/g.105034  ORF Transcript_56737/g.105034 Transcript_56737/m.105034 type:complete len:111 (-) Transcript_56737:228-560(-)
MVGGSVNTLEAGSSEPILKDPVVLATLEPGMPKSDFIEAVVGTILTLAGAEETLCMDPGGAPCKMRDSSSFFMFDAEPSLGGPKAVPELTEAKVGTGCPMLSSDRVRMPS